nr:hypothetical protein CFP56_22134 [Quercus suber]
MRAMRYIGKRISLHMVSPADGECSPAKRATKLEDTRGFRRWYSFFLSLTRLEASYCGKKWLYRRYERRHGGSASFLLRFMLLFYPQGATDENKGGSRHSKDTRQRRTGGDAERQAYQEKTSIQSLQTFASLVYNVGSRTWFMQKAISHAFLDSPTHRHRRH